MAEQLKSYEFTKSSGRRSKYPWDEWLDGTIWRVKQGEDFDIDTKNFRNSVRAAAFKRGLGVHTEVEDDKTLVFQTHEKKDKK